MIYKIMVILLLNFTVLFFFTSNATSIDITANGGWNWTITSADLISGPGSDLKNFYESPARATIIRITNTLNKNDTWKIDISRADNIWHPDFTFSAKRTSNGTGNGAILGGVPLNAYLQITTFSTEFFNGKGNLNNIYIMYKLEGMSVNIGPNIYNTIITYTIVDT